MGLRYAIQLKYNVVHLDFGREINKYFKNTILDNSWNIDNWDKVRECEITGPDKHFNIFRLLSSEQTLLDMLNND